MNAIGDAAKHLFRFVVQQVEQTTRAVIPAIKGIGEPPQHNRVGIVKLVSVGIGSLYFGGALAHWGAKYLENSGLFVPAEDDDDDD